MVKKYININGKEVLTYGNVLREATEGEKQASGIFDGDTYLIVDFEINGVEYRGLWSTLELSHP